MPTIVVVDAGRTSWLGTVIWGAIGAGLGGLFGLAAQSSGSPLFAVPVVIGAGLLVRAWRRRAARDWADLAAFLLGAGALALAFAVPSALNPMCMGSASGATAPTDCTINYYAAGVAALYAACLIIGSVLMTRAAGHSDPPSALSARPLP